MAKYKCEVCGHRFKLKKENAYLVKKAATIAPAFSGGTETQECFDCPQCGCQQVLNERLKQVGFSCKHTPTPMLVEELSNRDGVEKTIAEPYQDVEVKANGPAIILTIID